MVGVQKIILTITKDLCKSHARLQIGHIRTTRIHDSSMISAYRLEIVHACRANLSRFDLAHDFCRGPNTDLK